MARKTAEKPEKKTIGGKRENSGRHKLNRENVLISMSTPALAELDARVAKLGKGKTRGDVLEAWLGHPAQKLPKE